MAALPPLFSCLRLSARTSMVVDPRIPPPLSLRGGRAGTPRAWSRSSLGGSAMASLLVLGEEKGRERKGGEIAGRERAESGGGRGEMLPARGERGPAGGDGRRGPAPGWRRRQMQSGSRGRHKGAHTEFL
ncbi:hypothetical protein VPH35_078038 [Triticum aestivum]